MNKPYRCPICNGTGLVPGGFYQSAIGGTAISSVSAEKCRQCNGGGIIWGRDDGLEDVITLKVHGKRFGEEEV